MAQELYKIANEANMVVNPEEEDLDEIYEKEISPFLVKLAKEGRYQVYFNIDDELYEESGLEYRECGDDYMVVPSYTWLTFLRTKMFTINIKNRIIRWDEVNCKPILN